MIFGVFKISGHSMLPSFLPHEKVAASSLPYLFQGPKVGDVILFQKENRIIVKRVVGLNGKLVHVAGDNKLDSAYNIEIEKQEIIAKVLFKI